MEGARIRELGLVFVCVGGGRIMGLHKLWGTYSMESSAALKCQCVYQYKKVFIIYCGLKELCAA